MEKRKPLKLSSAGGIASLSARVVILVHCFDL